MPTREDDEIVFEVPEEEPKQRGRGGGPKGLSVEQQAERNRRIVARKLRGESWAEIAADENLSIRRCKAILTEYRQSNPTLRHADPVEVVDELLHGYAQDLADLTTTWKRAEHASNLPAMVGAVNSRMVVRQRIAELLQAVGVLPNDLGTLRLEIDARITSERLIAVLERYELPETLFDEIEAVLAGHEPDVAALAAG